MFLNIYEWGLACLEILIGHLWVFLWTRIFISFIFILDYCYLIIDHIIITLCLITKLGFLKCVHVCVCVCVCVCVYIYIFFFCPSCTACEILVPQPGIIPMPPALEAWSLNHWTTREAPTFFAYIFWKYIFSNLLFINILFYDHIKNSFYAVIYQS